MHTDKEVKVKVLLTEKEVSYSDIYLQRKSTIFKAICISMILTGYFFGVYEMTWLAAITLSIFLVFIIMLPLALLITSNGAKKEYKSNYTLQQEATMIFNDSGYTVIRADNNHNYRKWNDLHSVRETKSGFFLYYSSQTATYLPKRCFSSAEEITFFKELLSNHLGPDRVSLKTIL